MACTQFEELNQFFHDNPLLKNGLQELYLDFPSGLRKFLAEWIEDKDWSEAKNDSELAENLYKEMMQRLNENQGSQLEDRLYYVRRLQMEYEEEPVRMAEVIDGILERERELLMNLQPAKTEQEEEGEEEETYQDDYKTKLEQVQRIEEELIYLHKAKSDLCMKMHELQEILTKETFPLTINGEVSTKDILEKNLDEHRRFLVQFEQNIKLKWREVFENLEPLVRAMLFEMGQFRRDQELTFVKAFPASRLKRRLEQLQGWCGTLGGLIWKFSQWTDQVEVEAELEDSHSQTLRKALSDWLQQLVKETAIMTQQPSPWVKVNKSTDGSSRDFELKLCILCAKELHASYTTSIVDATVFAESQCQTSEQLAQPHGIRACELRFNREKTKFDETGTAKICNVKVEKFSRPPKDSKDETRVCQQRYRISVSVKMTLSGLSPIEFQVCSLPFIINTGCNQTCDAMGALLLYLFPFGDQPHGCHYAPPFPCVGKRPVSSVIEMLNALIMALSPKRPLREDEMAYLSSRLQGRSSGEDAQIGFNEFLFDKVSHPGSGDFSFWKWFTAIVNLIENHLLEPWKDKVIHGFIGRAGAREKLKDTEEGTFLLRFSESKAKGDGQNACGALVPSVRVPRAVDKSGVNCVVQLGAEFFEKGSLANLCCGQFTDKGLRGHSLRLKRLYDTGQDLERALSKYTKDDASSASDRYKLFTLKFVVAPVIPKMSKLSLSDGAASETRGSRQDRSSASSSSASPATPAAAAAAAAAGLRRQNSSRSQTSNQPRSPSSLASPGTPAGSLVELMEVPAGSSPQQHHQGGHWGGGGGGSSFYGPSPVASPYSVQGVSGPFSPQRGSAATAPPPGVGVVVASPASVQTVHSQLSVDSPSSCPTSPESQEVITQLQQQHGSMPAAFQHHQQQQQQQQGSMGSAQLSQRNMAGGTMRVLQDSVEAMDVAPTFDGFQGFGGSSGSGGGGGGGGGGFQQRPDGVVVHGSGGGSEAAAVESGGQAHVHQQQPATGDLLRLLQNVSSAQNGTASLPAGVPNNMANMPNNMANMPNNLANIPNNTANMPNNMANMPNNTANMPNNMANMPNNTANMPNNMANMPNNMANMPNNTANMPNDMANNIPNNMPNNIPNNMPNNVPNLDALLQQEGELSSEQCVDMNRFNDIVEFLKAEAMSSP